LLLDTGTQPRGVHGERGLPGDHRQHLEISLAEHVRFPRIEIDHTDEIVVVNHRNR
jgi:hypothetical protein